METLDQNLGNKTIRYKTVNKEQLLVESQLRFPTCLLTTNIQQINNINMLIELECEYDTFIEKYKQLLDLHNILLELLDIRNQLTFRIRQLKRTNKRMAIL